MPARSLAIADRRIHLARLILSVAGVGMIIYLISAELFIIKAICLWCTSVHLITFLLFVMIVTTTPVVLAPGYGSSRPSYAIAPGSGVSGRRRHRTDR